jgi:hypothetical protein
MLATCHSFYFDTNFDQFLKSFAGVFGDGFRLQIGSPFIFNFAYSFSLK